MKYKNRLALEKSPYLLQHAHNPVDWYPWSDEAFNKAAADDKPVFLSIGYSTCHWCHVMEKESFEDEETAALLNDAFICIKVDREERPDIDGIYMTVCQMLTGSGGWPLTIVMTPDKKPFFAGTYFPKTSRYGRSGMLELIPRLKEIWLQRRTEVLKSAAEITGALNKPQPADSVPINASILPAAFNSLQQHFDSIHGGFGNAPKFPTPHNLNFLSRYYKKKNEQEPLDMVLKTLNRMRNGGIYDHIGFGFHRYSTDREWLVPHFEKMLYDQALICTAYIEAYKISHSESLRQTAEEILTYVMRDLTSDEGGFYSAEDADSEGVEGKFYLWSSNEIKEILCDDAPVFIRAFNIRSEGNWIDPHSGSPDGSNILHITEPVSDLAAQFNLSADVLLDKIEGMRRRLFAVRKERVHPYKDDKVLTDWNALMISAFAKSAAAFNEPKYIAPAVKAVEFINNRLTVAGGRLLHRYREGDAAVTGNLDDYAFLINALIDLYEVTFEIQYLRRALDLNLILYNHFWDNTDGGYFFTPDYGEKLIIRQKEIYDGALPSGNSVQLLNLLKLGRITADPAYDEQAALMVKTFSSAVSASPAGYTRFITSFDFAAGPSLEIIVCGSKNDLKTAELINYLHSRFLPNKILLLKDNESAAELTSIAPYIKNYEAAEGSPAVFICENYNCKLPVFGIEELEKLISGY